MTIVEAKKLIEFCQGKKIKSVRVGTFEVEFFDEPKENMNLDPVSLAKTLADSMPPDASMLFASSEDLEESKVNQ